MNLENEDEFVASIIDHYEDPYHSGPLEDATHVFEDANPICADRTRVSLRITRGQIEEAWFEGQGCVASQAATSILVEKVEGMSVEEARDFSADDLLELIGPLPPVRQKCCLLGWRVFQTALDSPLEDDEEDGGPNFGGPSLSEES